MPAGLQMDDDLSGEVEFDEFAAWNADRLHLEQQRQAASDKADIEAVPAGHPTPKSWTEMAGQGKEDFDAEYAVAVAAADAADAAGGAAAPGRAVGAGEELWGLGRVLRWTDGTARAIFDPDEYERAVESQQASNRHELAAVRLPLQLNRPPPSTAASGSCTPCCLSGARQNRNVSGADQQSKAGAGHDHGEGAAAGRHGPGD